MWYGLLIISLITIGIISDVPEESKQSSALWQIFVTLDIGGV